MKIMNEQGDENFPVLLEQVSRSNVWNESETHGLERSLGQEIQSELLENHHENIVTRY